jgi:hypothetical protein
MQSQPQWSVAIFSSRESPSTLATAIEAAVRAASHSRTLVDVVVNGNERLAQLTSEWVPVRIWHVSAGDKANAWNRYVHAIWPGSAVAFFVDGYAIVRPDAFGLISDGLERDPSALAATGVPTHGHSAKRLRAAMRRDGGIHGNLYAVRGETLSVLRERGFRLPLGIYRTDPILGAAIAFGLDPAANRWEARRVLVHPEATWGVLKERRGPLRAVQGTWARMLRQAQGVLENAALRDHFSIRKRRPESLPRTALDLVHSWIRANPAGARRIFRSHWLTPLAWRRLRTPRDWSQAEHAPRLLVTAGSGAGGR